MTPPRYENFVLWTQKYSDPEKKIRKLLLDHIYSQTGELWNKHPITPPPSAKPRTVVSSTLTKIVRGKGPFDDANIRGLLIDNKGTT